MASTVVQFDFGGGLWTPANPHDSVGQLSDGQRALDAMIMSLVVISQVLGNTGNI